MAKLVLDLEYDFDFILIGISCHAPNYRLCWALNNALEIELERKEDIELIVDSKKDEKGYFSFYYFSEEESHTDINIVSNRSRTGFLVPEMKQIDYFMQYWGPYQDEDSSELIQKIKQIPQVLTSMEIDPMTLKSRNNLLF